MPGKKFLYPQQTEPSVNIIPPDSEIMKLYNLTKTEIEIMQLIAQGNSTKMIAYKRGLSKFTEEVHRKNIFRKLNAKNMADVVAFAVNRQLNKK
jgi:DNA-binding NarL/FixJ family response regulator